MTLGEIFQKALLNTALGMGTVFCMLIFISLVISCFRFIPKGKKPEASKPAAAAVSKPAESDEDEDIVPAIGRVLLIRNAEVYADGPKEQMLRGEVLSDLFGVPLVVDVHEGWYSLRGAYGD